MRLQGNDSCNRHIVGKCVGGEKHHLGLTDNAGPENDGSSKARGMKMQDVKMQDTKLLIEGTKQLFTCSVFTGCIVHNALI